MTPLPLFQHSVLWNGIFWTSLGAWFVLEFWIGRRRRENAHAKNLDRGSLSTIIWLIALGIGFACALPYLLPQGAMGASQSARFGGAIAMIWSGLLLRWWAVRTLGRFFRLQVVIHEDHQLVTSGPYRVLRNPSYTGVLMIVLGVGVAQGNWWSILAAVVPTFVAFAWRIHVEEAALQARFGDAFTGYKRRTWALIPFIR